MASRVCSSTIVLLFLDRTIKPCDCGTSAVSDLILVLIMSCFLFFVFIFIRLVLSTSDMSRLKLR